MIIVYSTDEFKPDTQYRRVFLYEDDGDAIMTGLLYEDELEDDAELEYDGPDE